MMLAPIPPVPATPRSALAASEKALRETEARFHELADNISQFAWTADETGWIYWYNQRWFDYTGTTLSDMEGWGWQKVHHPDHVQRVVDRIRRSFETGEPWEDTFPLRGKDGTYRWFLSRALPIRNDAGEVIRWFGTNTDITEQVEAERALRELNETLEQRVEAETRERSQVWNVSQDLLVVADLEGNYLSVNPAWTTVLGWSEAELLGKSSRWLLHPDDREKTLADSARRAPGGRTERFDVRFRHRDGTYRWISWKVVVERRRIYGVGRDATDRKEAEDKLRDARRELAQVTRRTTLAAMTASIAHEINQPLAAIVTNGSVALRRLKASEPDVGEVRGALERIVEDGHRASEIIASLRAMLGKDGQQGVPIGANDLVRDVLALVQGELDTHGVGVYGELADDLPTILGERVALQQVLLNLMMNAIEAMSTIGERTRVLTVQTRPHDAGGVLISVSDCGPGIDARNMHRIFDAFFTTKPQGMGMGLYICRSIVEAHDGKLWAESGVSHGAVFHMHLPAGN
jgi:PAS domain S-box-containing protein